MAFVPPEDDKIKKMGKKEKIPAYIYADPDDPTIIYIKTNGVIEILDNSLYEVVINNLRFEDGELIDKYRNDFVTEISPAYVDVDEVLTLCRNINLDRRDILMHIRSASEMAAYYAFKNDPDETLKFTKENLKEEYYPFYAYVKYQAAVESLKEFYIGAVTNPYKYRDELSDLAREEEMDLDAIRALIDDLQKEAEDWVDWIVTLTADPQWALRSKYSYAVDLKYTKPYHNTYIDSKGGGNGWGRGY